MIVIYVFCTINKLFIHCPAAHVQTIYHILITPDKVITNISNLENITLKFGYALSLSMFSNEDLIVNFLILLLESI